MGLANIIQMIIVLYIYPKTKLFTVIMFSDFIDKTIIARTVSMDSQSDTDLWYFIQWIPCNGEIPSLQQ